MSAAGTPKGWCPGAWRPMMSGDGLILRVRPRLGRLTAAQALGLAETAKTHGNGTIELTSRANLQLRGLRKATLDPALADLDRLGLLDPTPEDEARRNLLVTPFWRDGDLTHRLAEALLKRLKELPDLPAKFGFGIDASGAPILTADPADIRLETGTENGTETGTEGGAEGGLILRLDGAATGRAIAEDAAVDAVIEAALWFKRNSSDKIRRMRHLVAAGNVPDHWLGAPPAPSAGPASPGRHGAGYLAGVPFGQLTSEELTAAIHTSGARALRITPWRMVFFEAAARAPGAPFISEAGSPLMTVDACPGAPACAEATVETRALARRLATGLDGTLHVSGCAKGCARRGAAAVTLVGRNGRFDLVRDGSAKDAPQATGLTEKMIQQHIGSLHAL
ncbi:MAG: cobalamin biosynthesis protein CobG [Alphaproteobacteria bacterium]|nr:cobalamin biosynthesis protein CobG [Alphaproteobacteria bacterium]